MIKCPTADIDAVHAEITRLTRTLPQYGKFQNLLGIHTPLVDNDLWNSPHIGKQQSQDCARFDEFITMLNRNGFNFCRVVLMDLAKRIGDGCSVTGQFRCQQGHWAFHKVNGPRATIAHHVCFNVANGFGDRDVGKQMADLYGWDTLKKRALDRIGECPSAAFITGAEFAYVRSIVETA